MYYLMPEMSALFYNLLDCFRCVFKRRDNGIRFFVLYMMSLAIFTRMWRGGGSGLLYVQLKFDWDVVDYTNYSSVAAAVMAFQAFVVTTFYSYYVGMHDCLVSALGNYSSGSSYVVVVSDINTIKEESVYVK
jgi:hypothetical protein